MGITLRAKSKGFGGSTEGTKFNYQNTFIEWGVRNGYQSFFYPDTVELPEGISPNPYGWLPVTTQTDLIIPLVSIRPNEERTLYWFNEHIATNSDTPIRISLEANSDYDTATDSWVDTSWIAVAGYTITNAKDMKMGGLGMFKTGGGESIRLRAFPINQANNDWYFKWVAIDLPFID